MTPNDGIPFPTNCDKLQARLVDLGSFLETVVSLMSQMHGNVTRLARKVDCDGELPFSGFVLLDTEITMILLWSVS